MRPLFIFGFWGAGSNLSLQSGRTCNLAHDSRVPAIKQAVQVVEFVEFAQLSGVLSRCSPQPVYVLFVVWVVSRK